MAGQLLRGIAGLHSLEGIAAKDGRGVSAEDLAPLKRAALRIDRGLITWIGPVAKIPRAWAREKLREIDAGGLNVYPALIDCHTHLIYAGNRSQEFEWRNTGVSYQEIAARGGGILSTMRATRAAKKSALVASAQARVETLLRQGVGTIEVKSGYALSLKEELKCLEAARELKGARIVPTFLGAHARPPEFPTNAAYLEHLAREVLPLVARKGLSQRVDVFVEKGFFEAPETRRYLEAARALGFAITLHADQLSLSGGTALGIEFDALSVDHVIRIDTGLIARLARSRTTAVLLPAADLYMRCPYPPARALLDAGARVALATDHNPGTAPTLDTQLVGVLARLEMKMTLPEVFAAYTHNAAHALGLGEVAGSLTPGRRADFYLSAAEPEDHYLSVGRRLAHAVLIGGRVAAGSVSGHVAAGLNDRG